MRRSPHQYFHHSLLKKNQQQIRNCSTPKDVIAKAHHNSMIFPWKRKMKQLNNRLLKDPWIQRVEARETIIGSWYFQRYSICSKKLFVTVKTSKISNKT